MVEASMHNLYSLYDFASLNIITHILLKTSIDVCEIGEHCYTVIVDVNCFSRPQFMRL